MRTLTIRGVDESLSEKIKKAANTDSLSVNQFILNLIKKNFGEIKEKKFTKKYHDLDSLFGKWNDDEYRSVANELATQRRIDRELWK